MCESVFECGVRGGGVERVSERERVCERERVSERVCVCVSVSVSESVCVCVVCV